jgi:hypothetical protein
VVGPFATGTVVVWVVVVVSEVEALDDAAPVTGIEVRRSRSTPPSTTATVTSLRPVWRDHASGASTSASVAELS